MPITAPISHHQPVYWFEKKSEKTELALIREEPLSFRIQGNPYSVVMRTPGDEIVHAAGLCLAEGLVDSPDQIKNIAFCDGEESNVVTVTLTSQRYREIRGHLDRRAYISQTSCGLCGKELISDIQKAVEPVKKSATISSTALSKCLRDLPMMQPLRDQTRATHAAAIYDYTINLLSVAEDIGRHNALDKAVGKLFLDQQLSKAMLLILSSRISYELVQKAARANISVVAAYSRPTELAVNLAEKLNMTLVCLLKNGGLLVFSQPHRIVA